MLQFSRNKERLVRILARSAAATSAYTSNIKKKKSFSRRFAEDKWYLAFLLPAVLLLFFFSYLPMYGLAIAFQDYSIGKSLISADSVWVGFKHFRDFFNSVFFSRTFGNTIRLSLESIIFGAWVPLLAALLLNEIRCSWYKRTTQTMFYLPYFVSVAIVVSIMTMLTSSTGPVSMIAQAFGGKATNYMMKPECFDFLYVSSGIWQSFGYNSIIYLAGISGVDPTLYEAATVDGANRLHKMLHITLPQLIPTFITLLVLSLGGVLNTSYEKVLLMYNSATMERADVLGTYIYRIGLIDMKYSYTTAIGLFANVINFALVFFSNKLSNKLTGYGLW